MTSLPQMLARAAKTAAPAAALKSLTNDVAIQYLLADIPFFTVGVFALGAFTFCLVLRKGSWLKFALFLSIWMAFIAAILDLVETLNRGDIATSDANKYLGLTISREIAYSLSFGLRYIWFWGFVASRPPAAPFYDDTCVHSGSWHRWGLFGHMLKWIVLLGSLAIASLQAVYRVYTPAMSDGPVYDVEGTIQIVLTFLFILKLFMNIYLVSLDAPRTSSWRSTLLHYLPVLLALLVNLGIAIGNMLQFIFSETVLGRFLQAIELYILTLYTLIITFYHLRNVRENLDMGNRHNRTSSFNNIPRGAGVTPELIIPPPRLPSTDLISAFQRQLSSETSDRRRSSAFLNRQSSHGSRFTAWVGRRPSRRNAPALYPERDQDDLLWKQNQAEQGVSPMEHEIKLPMQGPYDPSPIESEPSPRFHVPMQVATMSDPEPPTRKGILATNNTLRVGVPGPPKPAHIRFSDGQGQQIELPPPVSPYVQTRTESPIYGLNGIVNARNVAQAVSAPVSALDDDPRALFDNTPRSSGISGLLRQQEELDKSIEALKLFSSDASEADLARRSASIRSNPRRASYAQSIESLSNFPEPPWGRTSTSTRRLSQETARSPVMYRPSSLANNALIPTLNISGHRVQPSVPSSEISDLMDPVARNRMNPQGTVEITSFIGKLTQPSHKPADSTATNLTVDTTGSYSGGLEVIKESPRSATHASPTDSTVRPPRDPQTSLLSAFPVVPTSSVPWPEVANLDRSQSTSQRRPMGLPSGPKLSSGRSNTGGMSTSGT
ncbi:hypothetical protein BDW22DRAFT_116634 [Trametopsis cervina]|nr:hypothetical protein BDW22DRAFT_116634 [Trametopsis cervina]